MPYKNKEDKLKHDKEYYGKNKMKWKKYGKKQRANPEWRELHRKDCLVWNKEHKERNNGNSTRKPEQWKAQSQAEKIPLAELCELCPEEDKQKATQRHHPDYDYPEIFVSCCVSCHNYVEKGDN